tara:strand:- start:329 stop:718 length:390 start_codon:yes stop_codon:yes gene_type:complete
MKILGIGVDMIKNRRIKNSIKKKKFLKRIYSKKEIMISKQISNKSNYYAKRFAAKESFAKALGYGFRKNLNFKDIEVLNDKYGKPYFLKSKKIIELVYKKFKTRKFNIFLSISDEEDYSIAFTILQKKL